MVAAMAGSDYGGRRDWLDFDYAGLLPQLGSIYLVDGDGVAANRHGGHRVIVG